MDLFLLIYSMSTMMLILTGTFVACIIVLIAYALGSVGRCEAFDIIDIPSWVGFVPWYREVLTGKEVGKEAQAIVEVIVSVLSIALSVMMIWLSLQNVTNGIPQIMPVMLAIVIVLSVLFLILRFLVYEPLAGKLGHGRAFALGMTLLPAVFFLVAGSGVGVSKKL